MKTKLNRRKTDKKICQRTEEGVSLVMPCKGVCQRYKAIKPADRRRGRYISGQKRCQICSIFIIWGGFFCPCCGYRLRTKPRYGKYKVILALSQSKKPSKNST